MPRHPGGGGRAAARAGAWLRRRAAYARRNLRLRDVRASFGVCPVCAGALPGDHTAFVRFFDGDFGVRCMRCGSARNTVALVAALLRHAGAQLRGGDVLLSSQRGPLFDFVMRTASAGRVITTAYIEGAAPGAVVAGVRHEDLQALSFEDARFDLVVNQEIFEHVVDDRRAFREVLRVLRPGGVLAFTVPLEPRRAVTLERAALRDGAVVHLTEPEYHDEPNGGRILAFRSYGDDVVDRLREAGFASAFIEPGRQARLGSLADGRPIVVALKGGGHE